MTVQEAKMQIQAIPSKIWEQLSPCDNEAMGIAIEALEKIEKLETNKTYNLYRQYLSIGTVEELKEARELFEKTKIVGVENIIFIRKDGTYEVDGIDVLAAIQKQIPKKPIETEHFNCLNYECPICGGGLYHEQQYCDECGQELKWEEEDD